MEKIRIMELLLHCADISNCVKPWNIHTKFTGELLEEFFKQVSLFPKKPIHRNIPKNLIHRKLTIHRKLLIVRNAGLSKIPDTKFLG